MLRGRFVVVGEVYGVYVCRWWWWWVIRQRGVPRGRARRRMAVALP